MEKKYPVLEFENLSVDYITLEDLCSTLSIDIKTLNILMKKYNVKILEQKIDLKISDFYVNKAIFYKNDFLNFQIQENLQGNNYLVFRNYILYNDAKKIINYSNLNQITNICNFKNTATFNNGELSLTEESNNNPSFFEIEKKYSNSLEKISELEKKMADLESENKNLKKSIKELSETQNGKIFTEKRKNTVIAIVKLCFEIAKKNKEMQYTKDELLKKVNSINKSKTSILGNYFDIFWKSIPQEFKKGPGRPSGKDTPNPTQKRDHGKANPKLPDTSYENRKIITDKSRYERCVGHSVGQVKFGKKKGPRFYI